MGEIETDTTLTLTPSEVKTLSTVLEVFIDGWSEEDDSKEELEDMCKVFTKLGNFVMEW